MTWSLSIVVAEMVGLGWALGLALYTSVTFALYLGGMPSSVAAGVALPLALLGLVIAGRWLWAVRRLDAGRMTGRPVLVALALALPAMQVTAAFYLALRVPLSAYDAWSIWAFKARMFATGGFRPGYLHDPATLFTHPDYPLNLPLAEAALFRLAGHPEARLAALLGPLCLAALLLLYLAGLTRLYGRLAAALGLCALAVVPALVTQAAGGDADVPLAMYAGGAALYLLLWWRRRGWPDAVLCGLLAGGAAWTKKEGLPIAGLLLLAFLVGEIGRSRRVGRKWRMWGIVRILPAFLAVPLPWLLFTLASHPGGRDFLPLTPATLAAHADRLPQIGAFVALQMLSFANWSLLWVLVAAALVAAGRRLTPAGRGLLALLAGQLGVYVLAFVLSDWQPYTDHMRTSLDRLLVQAVPLALLVLVETIHALGRVRARPVASPIHRQNAA